jgi:hypothetical protein
VKSTIDGFWILMLVGVLALVGWEANLYYFGPDATVRKVIDSCEVDATKVYALEISKWKIENHTDVLNPYRRDRDSMVEDCVTRQGSWCPVNVATDIWPCAFADCFVPTGDVARWVYNLRFPDRAKWKCK